MQKGTHYLRSACHIGKATQSRHERGFLLPPNGTHRKLRVALTRKPANGILTGRFVLLICLQLAHIVHTD